MSNEVIVPSDLIAEIRQIMITARQNVAKQVNSEQLFAYWNMAVRSWNMSRTVMSGLIIEKKQSGSFHEFYRRSLEKFFSFQPSEYALLIFNLAA